MHTFDANKTINKYKYLSIYELNQILICARSDLALQRFKLEECNDILANCYEKINYCTSKYRILHYLDIRLEALENQEDILEDIERSKFVIKTVEEIKRIKYRQMSKKLMILDSFYKQKKLKQKHFVNSNNNNVSNG